jgi:general secretion pathway protein G
MQLQEKRETTAGKTTFRREPRMGVNRSAWQEGFTLLELLVVLVILGLLAVLAVPQAIKYLGGAKTDTAKLQIQSLGANLDLFRLDVGRYPTQGEGLSALTDRPAGNDRWKGPYVKKRESLLDPWGRPYSYRVPGQHGEYDLFTLGADNAPGGDGENQDIVSW